ncbi:hypothetical protein [Thiolapillus sp.]
MNPINGIGSSSLNNSALNNASAEQPTEFDAAEWFSPVLAGGSHMVTATPGFDAGTPVDQIAQQVVSHICDLPGN